MFFDCVVLVVGLFVVVVSKWLLSEWFLYGFGKIEMLSGFVNGVFLIFISVEIMIEVCECMMEGREIKWFGELFVVSMLGLLVNLVGMVVFGYYYYGYDYGYFYSGCGGYLYGYDYKYDYGYDYDYRDEKKDVYGYLYLYFYDNENMYGIYFYVLVDILGSVVVIVLIIFIYFYKWVGWDFLVFFFIVFLILFLVLLLVKFLVRRLLFMILFEIEYNLCDILFGIIGLKGVVSYVVFKFWMDDWYSEGGLVNKFFGVMYVVVGWGMDMEDVWDCVCNYLFEYNIDIML